MKQAINSFQKETFKTATVLFGAMEAVTMTLSKYGRVLDIRKYNRQGIISFQHAT